MGNIGTLMIFPRNVKTFEITIVAVYFQLTRLNYPEMKYANMLTDTCVSAKVMWSYHVDSLTTLLTFVSPNLTIPDDRVFF